MSKAQAQKYLQKQKPNTFITLRREQFEEFETALVRVLLDGPYQHGVSWCRGCSEWATDHQHTCPMFLLSKLEKV